MGIAPAGGSMHGDEQLGCSESTKRTQRNHVGRFFRNAGFQPVRAICTVWKPALGGTFKTKPTWPGREVDRLCKTKPTRPNGGIRRLCKTNPTSPNLTRWAMQLARVFGRTYSGGMNLPVTLRRWTAVGLIVGATVLTTSVLLAKPGVVKTKTGHTYYGDVNKADDGTVTVTIRGAEKKGPQEEVDSISDQPGDFPADYNPRRQKLDPKDVAGRIELSHFALDNGEYVMAYAEAQEALQLDPNNAEAKKLLDAIRVEQRADRQRGLRRNQPGGGATTQPGGNTPPGTGAPPSLPPEMTPRTPT